MLSQRILCNGDLLPHSIPMILLGAGIRFVDGNHRSHAVGSLVAGVQL